MVLAVSRSVYNPPAPPGARRSWITKARSYPVPGRFTSPPSARPRGTAALAKFCQILALSPLTAASVFRFVFRRPPGAPLDPPDARNTININCFLMISKSDLSGLWPILDPKRDPKKSTFSPFWPPGGLLAPPKVLLEAQGPRQAPFEPSERNFGPSRPICRRFFCPFCKICLKNRALPIN